MTPKEASTTKARKTSTKSTVNPQTVNTATSDENSASIEAGIRHVIPEAPRPFLFGFMPSLTARPPMTIICIVDDSNCCVRSRGIPPCHSIAGMKRAIKILVSMVRFVITIPQTRNAIVGLPPTVATVRPKSPALDLSWQLSHKTSAAKYDRIQCRRDFTANDEIEKSPRLSRTEAIFGVEKNFQVST